MSLKGILKGITNRSLKEVGLLSSELEELGQVRLKVCGSCSLFDQGSLKCKECGCFMKTKVLVKKAKCPLNKW